MMIRYLRAFAKKKIKRINFKQKYYCSLIGVAQSQRNENVLKKKSLVSIFNTL